MSDVKSKRQQLRVICAYCRKPLSGQERWENSDWVEAAERTGRLSHGICPDCLLQHYPNEYLAIQEERKVRIRNAFKKGFTDLYGYLAK